MNGALPRPGPDFGTGVIGETRALRAPVIPAKEAAATLGDFYFKDGKYAHAMKAYQESLDFDPSDPELLDRMERASKAGSHQRAKTQ
jgi:tetratricopeptide (TPR) repeat protein